VDDVQSITEFDYSFDAQARKLTVTFTVETPYGTVEVTA
jgi:hypothetical protein